MHSLVTFNKSTSKAIEDNRHRNKARLLRGHQPWSSCLLRDHGLCHSPHLWTTRADLTFVADIGNHYGTLQACRLRLVFGHEVKGGMVEHPWQDAPSRAVFQITTLLAL